MRYSFNTDFMSHRETYTLALQAAYFTEYQYDSTTNPLHGEKPQSQARPTYNALSCITEQQATGNSVINDISTIPVLLATTLSFRTSAAALVLNDELPCVISTRDGEY